MAITSFYNRDELMQIGLVHAGDGCLVSRHANIYSPNKITIGDHVRLDDFCILSGHVDIGSYVHVAAYSALYGGEAGIFIEDYANISSHVSIYSVSDDYSGETMTNPMIPDDYKNVTSAPVHIGRHVIVGSTSVIMPGVTLHEGSAFGSFSFINHDSEPWSMNAGIPFCKIKDRSMNLLELESKFKYGGVTAWGNWSSHNFERRCAA